VFTASLEHIIIVLVYNKLYRHVDCNVSRSGYACGRNKPFRHSRGAFSSSNDAILRSTIVAFV